MFRFTNVLAAVALTVGVAGAAEAASYSFSTGESPFYPADPNNQFSSDLNQGWWSNGFGGINDNPNVVAGDTTNYLYRNFFTFDLSSLSLAANEKIVGASLSGFTYSVEVAGGPFETYALYDVSTDAATLNLNQGVNLAIYEDLGTGDSYGSRNFFTTDSNSEFSMDLNEFAFEDILAAQGDFFSLGGAILTLDDSGFREWVFGFSSGDPRAYTLNIETQISAVPLPAAFPLYGAGLAVLGFLGWRKKRQAAAA